MNKTLLFFLMLILSLSFASAYTIDSVNNNVYIDTAQAKILVSPHTLTSSGCSYINITNKNNNNLYDLVIGTEPSAVVSRIGLWTSFVNGSNTSYYFAEQNITAINNTYDNKTVWYETNGIQMNKNTNLYLEMCLDITPGTSGKYDVGAHLSSQTLAQAISGGTLFLLDPWYNSTTNTDYAGNVFPNYWSTINNGSSTVRIQPVFPLQDNLLDSFGGESLTTSELGRYTVTNSGATLTTGKIGNAYNINGGTNYIDLGQLDNNVGNMTISMWVNSSNYAAANIAMITKSGGGSSNSQYEMRMSGTQAQWTMSATCNGVFKTPSAKTVLQNNQWYHLVAVFNGVNISMYTNSVLDTNTSQTFDCVFPRVTYAGNNLLGKRSDGLNWNGLIDEVKIYNKALNASEILAEYNNGSGRKYQQVNLQNQYPYNDNLVSYWGFNNNTLDEYYLNSGIFAGTTNPTITTGKIGNAYNFDGTNQSISIGTKSYGNFTISTWIKRNQPTKTGEEYFFGSRTASVYNEIGYAPSAVGNKTIYAMQSSAGNYRVLYANTTLISDTNWHHICVIRNGVTAQIWIDGINQTIATYSSGGTPVTITTGINYQIGARNNDATYFNGSIDEFSIYNDTNINCSYLYNSGAGRVYNETSNMFYSIQSNPWGAQQISVDGNYTVLTYLSNGTFNTTKNLTNVSVLVVAGGGSGTSGGGGAGGLIYQNANFTINPGNYNITIGSGGIAGLPDTNQGTGGTNSSAFGLNALGGGAGGNTNQAGLNGGSGGGGGLSGNTAPRVGGSGLAGQGTNGGNAGPITGNLEAGGGGGSSTAGVTATNACSGNGGNGTLINITGTATYYAGGGAGGQWNDVSCGGLGGLGGGGNQSDSTIGGYGVNGTGSGGAGGSSVSGIKAGGNGGTGIVIIRVLSSQLETYYSSGFIMNLTASDNNALVRVSANNGVNWGNWYNASSNNQSLPFTVAGNQLMFQINLTNGNSTYSPTVSAFGITNTTIIGIIYSIIGQTLYNNSIIANSRMFIYNDADSLLATTTSNGTGWYNFTSLTNNTWYIVDARFSNSSVHYTKSSYFNVLTNTTNGTMDYFSTGTTTTTYNYQCSSISIAPGCFISLISGGMCALTQ